MITRIPRSSFSANINNTAQTNEHQTLSELFYKELEDKFSGKELATPLLKSFSENCRQNGRHIFSNKDFVIKFSTSVLQADKKEITIINKNENTTLTQTIAPIFKNTKSPIRTLVDTLASMLMIQPWPSFTSEQTSAPWRMMFGK